MSASISLTFASNAASGSLYFLFTAFLPSFSSLLMRLRSAQHAFASLRSISAASSAVTPS